jgi:Rrf2 family iron-sulfur cluster assembly transcriptional regulator
MRLSSKSRHAVAAMIDLGLKSRARPVALVDILDDHDISLSYLEQIFSRLKDSKLVVGIRGPRGGYRLARPAEEISMADIVSAVEDASYRGRKSRVTGRQSPAHELWDQLSERIHDFLDDIKLAELLEKANIAEFARRNPRHFQDSEYLPRRRAA